MKINSRRNNDAEFKLEAVKLITDGGYRIEQDADSVGISTSVISK